MLVTVLVDVFPFLPTGFWTNQAFNGVQLAVLFLLMVRLILQQIEKRKLVE